MTLKELKEECRKNGLKVSGTKDELIERLKKPTEKDISTDTTKKFLTIGFRLGDPKKEKLKRLLVKGLAKFKYYSCDIYYYRVDKKSWVEVLKY